MKRVLRFAEAENLFSVRAEGSHSRRWPASPNCSALELVDAQTPMVDVARHWLAERHDQLVAGELALASYRHYEKAVRLYVLPQLGGLPLGDITRGHVRKLLAHNRQRPAAANVAVDVTRRIVAHAIERGAPLPHGNAARGIRKLPELASSRPASRAVVLRILHATTEIRAGQSTACHPSIAATVQLIATTGCRPSEARTLQWDHVDLGHGDYGCLRLPRHKTSRRTGTKTIVLGQLSRGVLLSLNPEDPDDVQWVFPSHRRSGHPYCDFYRGWQSILELAGVGHVQLRDLRSGLATNANDLGVPAELIQQMLGHARLETTMRYIRISSSRVARAYDHVHGAMFRGLQSQ
ncbi:MAG: tyrosine-type recombinase/integrase [Deltaproteobacteria bacterium]|nr:tyrosine-type recombinase/integrase [Deltaproteobacteria bacterium]